MSKSFISKRKINSGESVKASDLRQGVFEFIKDTHVDFSKDCYISLDELNNYRRLYLTSLITKERGELEVIDTAVFNAIKNNTILSENIEEELESKLTLGQRLADKIASFGGSWTFIITFFSFILIWMIINIWLLEKKYLTHATGSNGPISVTSTDYDGDGQSDLAVVNYANNNVWVLQNAGAGTFNTAVNYAVGAAPYSVTSADYNGDGKPDLATTNYNDNNVSVLPNTGTGTFSAAVNYAVGTHPYTVISADYNGDGLPDLGVANYSSNDVSVLLNTIVFGTALNFDGSANDQINMGTSMNARLSTLNAITVEAWVNPATISAPAYAEIIGNYSSPANQMQFMLRQQQNAYVFFVDPGTGYQQVISTVGTATANVWQHVVGVWDGSNLMIYVNGVLQGTQTSVVGPHLNSTITNSVVIGYESAGEGFIGNMDEIRVWGRALCSSEIMNNMNAEVKLPQTGLLAYYQFNEGFSNNANPTVTTLADSSGNGYDGTLQNFALTGTTSNWVAPGAVTTGSYVPAFVPPTITVNSPTICAGTTTTLTASGVTTYTWNTTETTASITATPTITTNYTITGADANGCMNIATTSIDVNSLPTITVNTPTVCVGNTATLTASGTATSYTWSTTETTASISATPTTTANYTVNATDANGCMNMATASIDVNSLPNITASSSTVTLCSGNTATLTASGSVTSYTWSTTETTPSIAVSPTITATYTLIGTDANGCENMTTITQSVTTCGAGINQYSISSNEVTIYPNPNNGNFVVTTTENTNTIIVNDILGNVLLSVTPTNISTNITLSAQPSGVYFIKAIANGTQTVKRIIINN